MAQTYVRKTNLPHVYIDTENGASINSKTTYIYSTMHYVDEDDVVTSYDSMLIRGRGNSTWNLPKKPYKIKFNQKEKFLGKGYAKAKKWTLLANAGDKTMIRNAITSLMGDFIGLKNNPAHKFVDLTLNGVPQGTYQISDQVDVRPHRVNIEEQDYPITDESDITGGYLLEVDGFLDGTIFYTARYGLPINIHYPEDDEIVAVQSNYIRQYLANFEDILVSDNFTDAELGYRQWVDSVSLVNWYIATEVSGNVDGFWSTYFYKNQQDPKLYWGPLWDYDIAYGNDNRKGDTSQQMMIDVAFENVNSRPVLKSWINRMWEDPWFGRLVNRRYAEVVEAGLEEYLYSQIDSLAELLQESQRLNYGRWGISARVLRERVLYSSYDQYVADLKSYIGTHIPYLTTAFANKKVAEPTPPFVPDDVYYTIRNANTGRAVSTYSMNGQDGDLVCSWGIDASLSSQQWRIIPVDGYFMLLNRNGGMALNDPTVGDVTPTTNLNTQLNTVTPDMESDRQLWSIVPQGSADYYNFVNKYTGHTANLRGGGSADGTAIISYSTDSKNSTSKNRLWYIDAGDPVEEEPDLIASVEPEEYALAYNPDTHVLHFGSETPDMLTFTARVYSSGGTQVRTFLASQSCSVADLPQGIYMVVWTVGGRTRSAKLLIR